MSDLKDMPVVTVEQIVRFREAVFAEIERLQRVNNELRELATKREKRIHELMADGVQDFAKGYCDGKIANLEEELAALKAYQENTEPFEWIRDNGNGFWEFTDGGDPIGFAVYTTPTAAIDAAMEQTKEQTK